MTGKPIMCNLDVFSPEEHTCHSDLSTQWQAAIQKVVELPNGYGFRFEPDPTMLMILAEFITYESRCCPFFHFEITLESDGPLWLKLSGPDGVKQLFGDAFKST